MTWPRCKSVNASTLMCLMPNFLQKNCRRFQQKWHEDPWCNCRSPAGHFSSAQILQLECFCHHRPNGLPRFITSGIESSKNTPKLIRLIALNQKVSRVCSGLGARTVTAALSLDRGCWHGALVFGLPQILYTKDDGFVDFSGVRSQCTLSCPLRSILERILPHYLLGCFRKLRYLI